MLPERLLLVVAVPIVVMACLACASADQRSTPIGSEGASVAHSILESAEASQASSQLGALRDGFVTFTEYEAAVLRMVHCVEEAGGELDTSLEANQLQVIYITFRFPAGTAADTYVECYDAHLSYVAMVWETSRVPSEELLQAARNRFGQCLREFGFDLVDPVPDGAVTDLMVEAMSAGDREDLKDWGHCQEIVVEEFGLPGFAG